ncbi:MAG: TonB-dependent receptor plug domain-containing protein [Roseibacillus sp.]
MRLLGYLLAAVTLPAQTELEETVVIAERLPSSWLAPNFDDSAISQRNPLSVDQLLLEDPAVSLFRRQDATFANPTAAGVSLRRTGATATARTLVLRDGIPQNDPFGGWISWMRYRPSLFDSIRIVPSANATAWGNQSTSGTIQLSSRDPWTPFHELSTTLGSRETWALETTHNFSNNDQTIALQVNAFTFQSDGHHPLASNQRGAIDRTLSVEASGIDLRTTWRPQEDFQLEATLSAFQEERGNGSDLTNNATDALDFSLRATWETPTVTHQATGYYQQRDFAAVFTSQAADRSSESIALDQFDVPGTGIGGSFSSRFSAWENLTLTLGLDARHLDGETNERVAFDNRIRTAGGTQTFLGAFLQASTTLPSDIELDASARLDYYQSRDGILREVRTDGTFRTNDSYPDQESWEPSFGLTLGKQTTDTLHLSAGLSSSFRAPTLNELYRGFRVRNDITNANPDLDPERFYSAELTATYTPSQTTEWSNTLFAHHISDAIANVPLTIAPTGTTAQRLNVDSARVYGLESRFHYQPCDTFQATLSYQFTETEFTDSDRQPLLEGEPFPHSPRHKAVASLSWQAASYLALGASTTYSSSAYDDALATRKLDNYWTSSISAQYHATEHLTLIGRIDNLFDQDIETGLASNELLSLATPRTFLLTARYRW